MPANKLTFFHGIIAPHHLHGPHLSVTGRDLQHQFEALEGSSEGQAPSPPHVASPGGDDDDDDDDGGDDGGGDVDGVDDSDGKNQPPAPSGSSSSLPVHRLL